MTVWANKNGSSSTNWSFDGGDVVVTNWSNKTGNTPAQLYGTADENTGITGTYTSLASATASVVGGKYHLFDNVEFKLGTDSDLSFQYNTTLNGFNINSEISSASNHLFTLSNVDSEIFGVGHDGIIRSSGGIKITTLSLPSNPTTGRMAFSGNNLYIAK